MTLYNHGCTIPPYPEIAGLTREGWEMIDLRNYTGSLVSQSAKSLYEDAVNDCAWIKYMQEVTKNGRGLLQDNYSHRAAADALHHAIPLELAAHIEEMGADCHDEYIYNNDAQKLQLMNLLLEYSIAKTTDESNAIAKKIANHLYKNVMSHAMIKAEDDIRDLYEEYYESGQYARDKAEDDGYEFHRTMNDTVTIGA